MYDCYYYFEFVFLLLLLNYVGDFLWNSNPSQPNHKNPSVLRFPLAKLWFKPQGDHKPFWGSSMEVRRKRLFTNGVVPRERIHVITCEIREELRFEPRPFKSAPDYKSTFYLLCDGCSCPKVSIQVLKSPGSLEKIGIFSITSDHCSCYSSLPLK